MANDNLGVPEDGRPLRAGLSQQAAEPEVSALRASIPDAETFATVIEWGDQTFGPCTADRAIERAWEEWQEMIAPGADVLVEAADVIIVLLRIPGIAEAIQRKMKINRGRQWRFMGDGTGYHIPAQGTEARRAETGTGSVHDGPIPQGCAPTSPATLTKEGGNRG